TFSRDGSLLASGELNGLIRLWDVASGKSRFPLGQHTGGVRCLHFSPDGKWLASCGYDGCLRLSSIPDGGVRHYCKVHAKGVWCIYFSPDSRRLLTASIDGTARIWEVPVSLQASRWVATRGQPVLNVVFAPANRRLALSTADDRILCGDASVPGLLVTLPVTAYGGCPPAFSPDGNELAFLGSDSSIRRWRFAEQRELTPRQPRSLPAGEPEWKNKYVRLAYLSDNRLAAVHSDGILLLGYGEIWQEYHLPCRSAYVPPLLAPLPDAKTIVV